MKYILFIVAAIGFVACQGPDKKVGNVSQVEKDNALKDSINYTTIKWVDSTFRDLGDLKEGQVVEVSYKFRNVGTKNLVITSVSASCGCTVPEKPEQAFAPGEEGSIKAKFDSRGHPGDARKTVYVEANTNPNHQELSFHVNVGK